MGRRGPPPKPSALKKLLGNPGKRTINEHEPVPPDGEIAPPPMLRANAREYWNLLAPLLKTMKVLTIADVMAFCRYCNLLARYHELDLALMTSGPMGTLMSTKDKNGKVTGLSEKPISWEYRQIQQQLLNLEREFGLTPAARSRLKVERPGATTAAEGGSSEPASGHDKELRDFFAGGGPAAPRTAAPG